RISHPPGLYAGANPAAALFARPGNICCARAALIASSPITKYAASPIATAVPERFHRPESSQVIQQRLIQRLGGRLKRRLQGCLKRLKLRDCAGEIGVLQLRK